MDTERRNESLLNTIVALLKRLKAHQEFVAWVRDKAGSHSQDIQDVFDSCLAEVESEPDLENKLRGIAEDALQRGETKFDLALVLALQQWTPKGNVN